MSGGDLYSNCSYSSECCTHQNHFKALPEGKISFNKSTNRFLLLPECAVVVSCTPAYCVHVNLARGGLQYLVEEALAELVHSALQLAALTLPLLVVAHRLGRGPLPCGGSGVVVDVVVPSPLVNSLLPAGGGDRGG